MRINREPAERRTARRNGRTGRWIAGWVLVGALCVPAAATAIVDPTIIGSVSNATDLSGAIAIAVSGRYAYTTAYAAGELTAVDISDPSHPFVAGASPQTASLQNASTVNIVGGYAYVVSKNRNASSHSNDDGTGNSLTILNISADPARPEIIGAVHDPARLFGAYGVAVSGHYAYVAAQGLLSGQPTQPDTSSGDFDVIDVADPATPTIVATLGNDSLPAPWTGTGALDHATAVAISGDYAYVTAARADRLTVIDIANPLSPTIVASLQDSTALSFDDDVAISGRYAYVADESTATGALAVVDVDSPSNPRVAATLTSPFLKGGYRIRVRGGFAYVASADAGTVTAVDVSDPLAPRFAAGVYDGLMHLNSVAGLDLDGTGRYAIVASPTLSTPHPGVNEAGTVSAIDLDPAPIAVRLSSASEPANPTAATQARFRFEANDAVSSVRCKLDRHPLTFCATATSQPYRSLRPGRHTFSVQATDAQGLSATRRYTWVVGPPASRVKASLLRQLVPRGRSSTIRAMLRSDGYATSLTALGPGAASIAWYFLPNGASLPRPASEGRRGAERRDGARAVLIADGRIGFDAAGSRQPKIELTSVGRHLLAHAIGLRLTAEGSFTPTAQAAVTAHETFELAGGVTGR